MTLVTSYHDTAFDHTRRAKAVHRITKTLARFPREVGIVCTGLSGILIGVPAAEKTERQFAIVRKKGETSHACNEVEGYKLAEYVIVDDFIDSGDTIRRIIDAMNKRNESSCRAVLLYDYSNSSNVSPIEYQGQKIKVIRCR